MAAKACVEIPKRSDCAPPKRAIEDVPVLVRPYVPTKVESGTWVYRLREKGLEVGKLRVEFL